MIIKREELKEMNLRQVMRPMVSVYEKDGYEFGLSMTMYYNENENPRMDNEVLVVEPIIGSKNYIMEEGPNTAGYLYVERLGVITRNGGLDGEEFRKEIMEVVIKSGFYDFHPLVEMGHFLIEDCIHETHSRFFDYFRLYVHGSVELKKEWISHWRTSNVEFSLTKDGAIMWKKQ